MAESRNEESHSGMLIVHAYLWLVVNWLQHDQPFLNYLRTEDNLTAGTRDTYSDQNYSDSDHEYCREWERTHLRP